MSRQNLSSSIRPNQIFHYTFQISTIEGNYWHHTERRDVITTQRSIITYPECGSFCAFSSCNRLTAGVPYMLTRAACWWDVTKYFYFSFSVPKYKEATYKYSQQKYKRSNINGVFRDVVKCLLMGAHPSPGKLQDPPDRCGVSTCWLNSIIGAQVCSGLVTMTGHSKILLHMSDKPTFIWVETPPKVSNFPIQAKWQKCSQVKTSLSCQMSSPQSVCAEIF